MASYHCRIITSDGRIIEDRFRAESKEELLVAFQERNYHPIEVVEEKQSFGEIEIGRKTLKSKSLILFCRQLATLLRSGVPLIRCFEVIASQTDDKVLKKSLTELSADIQGGMVLSGALAKQDEIFPPMLSKMVEVGEVTGDLTQIMERMASQYESNDRIKKKVKGAMTYPIVLISIAFAACVLMMIVVVPRFVEIFESLNTDLPLPTQILMACSDFLINRWYIVLILVPIIVIGLIRLFKQRKVKNFIDTYMLSFKLIKDPVQKIISAKLARTLYTLISSGVPIVQAMDYANQNIDNIVVNGAISEIIAGLQKGEGISSQMSNYPFFPKLLVSMISIGEVSGNLEEMLSKTADYYDEEMSSAIAQITSLLEPMMILVVGVLIGGVVMSLYAPMFGIISAMSGGA